jgi:hypothetical protein
MVGGDPFSHPDLPFDNRRLGLAVREVILSKLERLSEWEKEQVYETIYRWAGTPYKNLYDLNAGLAKTQPNIFYVGWGQAHKMENFPRLADALSVAPEEEVDEMELASEET